MVYVGVTRARRLLGLAIPASDRERVLAFLHRHGRPDRTAVGPTPAAQPRPSHLTPGFPATGKPILKNSK